MKYDLVRPCKKCPFRHDIPGYLRGERAEEIANSVLRQESFACHETTEEKEDDDGESEAVATADSQECAGAGIFAAHHGVSSQLSRIACRLGIKVAELDMSAPVFDDIDAMIDHHTEAERFDE